MLPCTVYEYMNSRILALLVAIISHLSMNESNQSTARVGGRSRDDDNVRVEKKEKAQHAQCTKHEARKNG